MDKKNTLDKPTLIISSGFLVIFIVVDLINEKYLGEIINTGFSFSIKWFGAYWQVLLLATFVVGLVLAFSRMGSVKLGGQEKPEFSNFQWLAVIMCTLVAGGGVFWAAAEPIAHFLSPPPLFGDTPNLFQKAINALTQSFMHWGFLACAILGVLTCVVLMYFHYEKGLPLKPRTLFYPIFGDKAIEGYIGTFVDAVSIIAVAAGTIGPIGFLGLQVSYILNGLFDIPNSFTTQLMVILLATVVYVVSALSGIHRGLQLLSRYNVVLAVVLMIYILLVGPTGFIFNAYAQSLVNVIENFIPMALYRENEVWLGWWTIFFWGWFLGYGPMMAIFISRISKGRTIREIVMVISIFSPLVTMFWFTVLGGTGIFYEINSPGSMNKFFEGLNLPGALLGVTQSLPFGEIITVLFLILTTVFIVTTGDSITYTISLVVTDNKHPHPLVRAYWGVLMGLTAMILVSLGSGGIDALQSFIVITAVPVSLILLPSLWNAPRIAKKLKEEQNL